MVEGSCYAMKRGLSAKFGVEATMRLKFSRYLRSGDLRMVTVDDLHKTMGKIDSMRTSDLLQIKVPMAFLATECFSRYRGGSYPLTR